MCELPVDRTLGDATRSEPVTEMGHSPSESSATDQRTGVVYMTEDPGGGRGAGFFRFLPDDPWKLAAGGRLQMLSITDLPNYDAREGQTPGKRLHVTWIDIADPDPPYRNPADERGVFEQGWALGAAKFNRLEGCWWSHGSVFFVSTSGGDVKNGDVNADGFREGFGQVWEYRRGKLILHYESPGGEVLELPRQPHRDPARRPDAGRGRRVERGRHRPDRPGPGERPPPDRHLPGRRGFVFAVSTSARPNSQASVQPGRPHVVREHLRAVDGHARAARRRRHDVRDHGPVAEGPAVSRANASRATAASRWRTRAVVRLPNATSRSARSARRWNTFWASVWDSR